MAWLTYELLTDFPFVLDATGLPAASASRANTLALLFTGLLRAVIQGPVPLALIDAPQQGTGKSLLASVLMLLATGQASAVRTAPAREEEWEKVITATLLAGTPICLLDNVVTLRSPAFVALLTATHWEGRILGVLQMAHLPHLTVWIATGNNVQLHGEMVRRIYWIRLNAEMATPWRRTGFRHDDLRAWVSAQRGALLAAALTVVRGWYAAGQPQVSTPASGGLRRGRRRSVVFWRSPGSTAS